MFIVFIEDDAENIKRIQELDDADNSISCAVTPDLPGAQDVLKRRDVDIVFVSSERERGVSLRQDFASLRALTHAPLGVLTHSAADDDLTEAISGGAELVLERKDLTVSVLRQWVRNLRARRAASNLRQVQICLQTLSAPLDYLEFGLTTLIDVQEHGGRATTREFMQHLLETVQTLKKMAQAQHGGLSGETVGRLVEHSRARMMRLAAQRGVSLRADWETARFQSGAPSQMAQLGLQHVLEGVLRCCGEGDGVWLHGEKTHEASVIRIHLSRRVFADADMLFPGAATGPGIGLDASSSMQLGALLLSLTQDKVRLNSEKRQQMLSLFLSA